MSIVNAAPCTAGSTDPTCTYADPLPQADNDAINGNWENWDTNSGQCATSTQSIPAGTLPSFIPEPYNGAFTAGANAHNVAPALIASLFSEEHNLGGSETSPNTANLAAAWANFIKQQPDPNSGWAGSSAGASGPFQFLPSTFTGLGYKVSDINNLAISADAAAKYAQSDQATKDKPESTWNAFIFSYNHAQWYVDAVLKYYDYYNSQPAATPGGTQPTTVDTSSSSGSGSCGCTGSGSGSKTIVLDPGHGQPPTNSADIDPGSQINTTDWTNPVEQAQVFQIAQDLNTKLTAAGYKVIMTKTTEGQYVNLKAREDVANQANAALGVSIHTSPGSISSSNMVFYPGVGGIRIKVDGSNSPPYSNAALAATDMTASQLMAKDRSAVEGQPVSSETYYTYTGGAIRMENTDNVPQGGNILEADYFATVPWVYNEQLQDGPNASITPAASAAYEAGLLKGIEDIVPISGGAAGTTPTGSTSTTPAAPATGASAGCAGGVVSGNISQTAVGLAWPDNSHGDAPPTPAYAAALKQFNQPGFSVTGGKGDDCGIFVATVMRASGADPNYPVSGTVQQADYVIAHPELYTVTYPATSTSQLQPGDILILNSDTTESNGVIHVGNGAGAAGHTFIYVGPQQPKGFNEASASLRDRTANLGLTALTDGRGSYLIARHK